MQIINYHLIITLSQHFPSMYLIIYTILLVCEPLSFYVLLLTC